MQSVIDETVAAPQFFSTLSGLFAGFALLLTVIGLFGLLSYQVTQRTRRSALRMALGADRARVMRHILRGGLLLSALGLGLGTIASMAVPKLVRSVLEDTYCRRKRHRCDFGEPLGSHSRFCGSNVARSDSCKLYASAASCRCRTHAGIENGVGEDDRTEKAGT